MYTPLSMRASRKRSRRLKRRRRTFPVLKSVCLMLVATDGDDFGRPICSVEYEPVVVLIFASMFLLRSFCDHQFTANLQKLLLVGNKGKFAGFSYNLISLL